MDGVVLDDFHGRVERIHHFTLFHLGGFHMAFGGSTFHLEIMMSPPFELDVTHLEHDITIFRDLFDVYFILALCRGKLRGQPSFYFVVENFMWKNLLGFSHINRQTLI
jgi:hypothetical protein